MVRSVSHERVQKRAAEQTEDAPQSPEETVEMVRSVSHERVQQRAAGRTGGAPQSPEETVEMVRSVSHERAHVHNDGTPEKEVWVRSGMLP